MHFRPQCVLCGLFTHFVGVVDAVGEDYTRMITEIGRGGACVPARVALQGRIRGSFPAHNACIFGMETPLRGRSGGHAGTAPTVSFGWIACGQLMPFGWITRGTVDVVWMDCAWVVDFVWEDCA